MTTTTTALIVRSLVRDLDVEVIDTGIETWPVKMIAKSGPMNVARRRVREAGLVAVGQGWHPPTNTSSAVVGTG